MKNIIIVLLLTTSFCFAETGIEIGINKQHLSFVDDINNYHWINQSNSINLKECKVRITKENDDGTVTEYEIIFDDLSWWNCSKVQLAAWYDRNF